MQEENFQFFFESNWFFITKSMVRSNNIIFLVKLKNVIVNVGNVILKDCFLVGNPLSASS